MVHAWSMPWGSQSPTTDVVPTRVTAMACEIAQRVYSVLLPATPRCPRLLRLQGKAEKGGDGEAPAKKARKKKDPNAPKNAMSAFMYFSNSNRDQVKAENPGGWVWCAGPRATGLPYGLLDHSVLGVGQAGRTHTRARVHARVPLSLIHMGVHA